jgi:hypothetical protein
MGAPTGNFNAANDRSFISALNRAIAQDDGVRLRMIAEKLLDKASAGELMAINMVADRLDGKPKQQLDANLNHTGDVTISKIERLIIDNATDTNAKDI